MADDAAANTLHDTQWDAIVVVCLCMITYWAINTRIRSAFQPNWGNFHCLEQLQANYSWDAKYSFGCKRSYTKYELGKKMCIQFSKISNQLINKSQHIRLIVFNQCHTRQLCCRIRNAFIFAFKICCFFAHRHFVAVNWTILQAVVEFCVSLILHTLHYSLIVSVYVSIVFAVSTFLLFICSLGRPILSRFSSR